MVDSEKPFHDTRRNIGIHGESSRPILTLFIMKNLSMKQMTSTMGRGYCEDLIIIADGALMSGNDELFALASYYYFLHCVN